MTVTPLLRIKIKTIRMNWILSSVHADIFGDPSEIRTPDTLIKSQVLCQLS